MAEPMAAMLFQVTFSFVPTGFSVSARKPLAYFFTCICSLSSLSLSSSHFFLEVFSFSQSLSQFLPSPCECYHNFWVMPPLPDRERLFEAERLWQQRRAFEVMLETSSYLLCSSLVSACLSRSMHFDCNISLSCMF